MSEIQLVTFLDSGDFASAKPFGFLEMVGAVGLEPATLDSSGSSGVNP